MLGWIFFALTSFILLGFIYISFKALSDKRKEVRYEPGGNYPDA